MTLAQNARTFAVALAMLAAWSLSAPADAPPTPARRVVACYFHRIVRCPTCQKVGSSLEETIKRSFPAELSSGRLEWRMMDFQDPRNASFAAAFGVTGPSFILMDVRDNRVVGWKPAPKAWSLISDPASFSRYVQSEVQSFLGVQATAAR